MKIKILERNKIKKNFLKEKCGGSAAPIGAMGVPPADDSAEVADISSLSPEEAFDAGYAAAINEINVMISDMIPGGDPVDSAALPAEIEVVDQLEEESDSKDDYKPKWEKTPKGYKPKWEKTPKDYKPKWKMEEDGECPES